MTLTAFFLGGCVNITKIVTEGKTQSPLSEDCVVDIIEKNKLPDNFETLGSIETHIKGNIFFGGVVRTNDEGFKELRKKTCLLGGNAVVIDDSMEIASVEMRHVHIWARVLRVAKPTNLQ